MGTDKNSDLQLNFSDIKTNYKINATDLSRQEIF